MAYTFTTYDSQLEMYSCQVGVASTGFGNVLGATFMRNFVVVFDYNNDGAFYLAVNINAPCGVKIGSRPF